MEREKKWKMPMEALTLVSARFKVLSEPLRLRILQELESDRHSVGELAEAVEASQPNVSKHLKILQDEGLILRRKEGNAVYYSIADPSVFELCDVVCNSLRNELSGLSVLFTKQD